MFERFTDSARQVLLLAREEATHLNHTYVGTEHLLLGMLRDGDGIAAKALESFGVSLDGARDRVRQVVGEGGAAPSEQFAVTPRLKKILELSLRERGRPRAHLVGGCRMGFGPDDGAVGLPGATHRVRSEGATMGRSSATTSDCPRDSPDHDPS